MGSGFLSDEVLKDMTNLVSEVEGDFAEVGIYRASLFSRLVPIGKGQGKEVFGFDSFCGLSEPTKKDRLYEKGELSVGGVKAFHDIMKSHDIPKEDYHLWQGYVPDCFLSFPSQIMFSLIYIDLDLYEPTVQAIEWAFPRLSEGGIIAFDDYFPKRDYLASPAIDAFLNDNCDRLELIHFSNSQIFLKMTQEIPSSTEN